MATFCVYVLLCRDGSFYIGSTSKLQQRIAQHHAGSFRSCYTFDRRPLKVVHVSEYGTADEAFTAERKLKRWSHAKKAAFVQQDFDALRRISNGRR
ncbi:MAG TPA: GIY-YIG nuclease family protein [Candidatus Elarobacter sp.]